MIAAKQWYEYQQQYQKYGLDMKPQESREHREKRRRAERQAVGLNIGVMKDHRLWLILLAVAVVVMIMVILMTAYAASVRYEINRVQSQNNQLWDDIKTLQSSQSTRNGVGYVEEKAGKELGMVAAGTERCVYITPDDVPSAGFADVLKAKAYQ